MRYKTSADTRAIYKRCSTCRKLVQLRQEYAKSRPVLRCKHCGAKIKIKKTLRNTGKHAHGIKMETIEFLTGQIFNFIKDNPGTYLSEICRNLNIGMMRVRVRIQLFLEKGFIRIVKDKQVKRFFVTKMKLEGLI
ncbi:MAG: hypothetical protein PHH48_08385 [Eubacteriales bacterium]|nr:hypothetical protein [Eubacteriales bacterium]